MQDASRFMTYHSFNLIPKEILDGLVKAYIEIFSDAPWHETWTPERVIEKLKLEMSTKPAFLTVMRGNDEYPVGGFCWGAVIPVASVIQRFRDAGRTVASQNSDLEKMVRKIRASKILFVDEIAIIPQFRDGMRPISSLGLPFLRMARNAGTGVIGWSTEESRIVPIILHFRFVSIATIGDLQFFWAPVSVVRYLNPVIENLAYTLSDPKKNIIDSAVSPYEQYCTGHGGGRQYLTALVMGISSVPKTFSHRGSSILDSVLAYDGAEVSDIYLGQINMTIVSSFCGPPGLIWGHDIVKPREALKSLEGMEHYPELSGIPVYSGAYLRNAARKLFGTNKKRRFPFLPGSHVFCAGRYMFIPGPAFVYAAVGIGIPEDRSGSAAVFMEDVGKIVSESGQAVKSRSEAQREIRSSMARSVVRVGNNQRVRYKEIIVDCVIKEIPEGEIGCSLVAIPYFHLAKSARTETLDQESIEDWFSRTESLGINA